MQGSGSRMMEE
jgi:hypothetical protein